MPSDHDPASALDDDAPSRAAPGASGAVRWGIGDFFWVLGAQYVGGLSAAVVVLQTAWGSKLSDDTALFGILLPAQSLAILAALLVVSRRKGRGSLRDDFGFRVSLRDWSALFGGLGWRLVIVVLLLPFLVLIETDGPSQQIVQEIEDARGALIWIGITLGVGVVQPALEEILFRGLLLRALLRRLPPGGAIAVSAAVFGGIHLLGVNLGLDAAVTVVGLTALGVVLAVQTLRTGSLSRSVLTHMSFNLTVVAGLALAQGS